ncbi:MAG: zinc ABC transporter substrate-binding protein [Lachnospiraceae bacterium]|nr:zinc ABC transporter substrate-binding protein [Lachnospiraceae bacterium]MBR0435183.1 zinc ABC transporter substrate-binding protein [Lachnospiraceae bacterium]
MKNKYVFTGAFLVLIIIITVVIGVVSNKKDKPENESIEVVASFYPVYVIANNLLDGIDDVNLNSLSEPKTGCLHDFQLTPEDMKLLEKADIFIINGSGAESFMDKIISDCEGITIINGTEGIEGEEELLMHAWMNPIKYLMEIENISHGLIDALPQYTDEIERNYKSYIKKVMGISVSKSKFPTFACNDVILFSEAFEPFAEYLGLNVLLTVDLDEEREVSSAEVKEVIDAINANPGIFIMVDEVYGKKLAETVKNEVEVKVYYIDPLTRGELTDKNYYIDKMNENIEVLYTEGQ